MRKVLLVAAAAALPWVPPAAGATPLRVHWLRGASAPATRSRLNRVGVLPRNALFFGMASFLKRVAAAR